MIQRKILYVLVLLVSLTLSAYSMYSWAYGRGEQAASAKFAEQLEQHQQDLNRVSKAANELSVAITDLRILQGNVIKDLDTRYNKLVLTTRGCTVTKDFKSAYKEAVK